MRILTRYVLREFLKPLAYCLTGFVSIYVLFDLFGSFSRMASAKISVADAATYFCGYLAPYWHYIAPAALMLATLYTMWRFCRHSEIVAMRAGGVSFAAIAMPLLAVAAAMAAFVAFVDEWYVPRHAQWAALMKTYQFDRAQFERGDNIVYRNAGASRTWNVGRSADSGATVLENVRVTVDRPDGGTRLMAAEAERAEHLDGEWWFFKPSVRHYDPEGREMATPTPEADALPLRCFPEFDERPQDFLTQNRPWRFNSVADRIRYLETHPGLSAEARRDCTYDVWAQIAAPFACLIITLFAIPAGIASGRQSVFAGILGALATYFAFYGTTIACMVAAKNGWFPPVPAALLPAALFLALGIRSFRRQR